MTQGHDKGLPIPGRSLQKEHRQLRSRNRQDHRTARSRSDSMAQAPDRIRAGCQPQHRREDTGSIPARLQLHASGRVFQMICARLLCVCCVLNPLGTTKAAALRQEHRCSFCFLEYAAIQLVVPCRIRKSAAHERVQMFPTDGLNKTIP